MVLNSFFTIKGLVLVPLMIVGVRVIDLKSIVYLLLGLMVIDFITGISASYYERKSKLKTFKDSGDEIEYAILKSENLISSEKLKMSGVKFALYGVTSLVAHAIQNIFLIKNFNLNFTELDFTITIVVISFWCIVEFYSIVFENFKKMGFDVVKIALNIFNKYKSTKDEVTSN